MDNDCLLLTIILLSILIYFFVLNNSNTEYYSSGTRRVGSQILSNASGIYCNPISAASRATHLILKRTGRVKPNGQPCVAHLDCVGNHCRAGKCVDECIRP